MRDELLYNLLSRRLLVSTVSLQILYGLVPLRNRTGLLLCEDPMVCLRLSVSVANCCWWYFCESQRSDDPNENDFIKENKLGEEFGNSQMHQLIVSGYYALTTLSNQRTTCFAHRSCHTDLASSYLTPVCTLSRSRPVTQIWQLPT